MKKPVLRERVGRRQFAAGAGVSLIGTLTPGIAAASNPENEEHVGPLQIPPGSPRTLGVYVDPRARKPIFLAAAKGSYAAHAVAEVLFWTDIMMEHAMFFTTLMPGDRLRAPRDEARHFQQIFAHHFVRARDNQWHDGGLLPLLSSVRSSVAQFVAYKRRMQEAQERGVLRSLVWPLFFDHTAHEGERFIRRLDQLATGSAALQLDEVRGFWTEIMGEHLEFVAHLLDPQERPLVEKATAKADQLLHTYKRYADRGELSTMADEVIDFKTAAEAGIETGAIRSIIDPSLADHVLREAVRFSDEIKRT